MKTINIIISKTLGKVSYKYRTLNDWLVEYETILQAENITKKSKDNMYPNIIHLREYLGDHLLSNVSPKDIANYLLLFKDHPNTVKRRLNETKRIFHSAFCYGWIDRNPAEPIKPPRVTILRQRLRFEDFLKIERYAKENMQPWVSIAFRLALITGQRRGDIIELKYSDIRDGHLLICQNKSGSKISLPLELKLNCYSYSLGDVIAESLLYSYGETIVRKHNRTPVCASYLSSVFETARNHSTNLPIDRSSPSFHEIRSLSERLYRKQGIDTTTLLGHKHQYITDIYNDPRNLSDESYKILKVYVLLLIESRQTTSLSNLYWSLPLTNRSTGISKAVNHCSAGTSRNCV